MSAREWKPGDVAMSDYGTSLVVAFSPMGCNSAHETYPVHVHYGDGDWGTLADLRPLVVIDPDDREQVERLHELLGWPFSSDRKVTDALREFANPTPPKPEEPTGLGAVVEAVCGCQVEPRRFVRHEEVDPNDPWEALCGWHVWDDFRTAVRVLSEGVTA